MLTTLITLAALHCLSVHSLELGTTHFVPADPLAGENGRGLTTQCNALLVMLHGLGDSGEGWKPTMFKLFQRHSHVCFVLPTAPLRQIQFNQAAPAKALRAWFSITEEALKPDVEGDSDGIKDSVALVEGVVSKYMKHIGEPYSRVVIAGFSQGAALALHAGLTLKHGPVAGIVSIGGWLPAPSLLVGRALLNKGGAKRRSPWHGETRILFLHGKTDDVIPMTLAQHAVRTLQAKAGVTHVQFHPFDGVGHGMNDPMLEKFSKFLETVVPVSFNEDEL